MKKLIALLLVLALVLCGCGQTDPQPDNTTPTSAPTTAATKPSGNDPTSAPTEPMPTGASEIPVLDDSLFSDRDRLTAYDESSAERIVFEGDHIATSTNDAVVSGTTVTITEKGTYVLSGTLDDGMVIVDIGKDDKVQLILNGVSITCSDCAPIYVRQADKVFVTLAENSENYLANGGVFTPMDEKNIDAVIYSREDLTLNGKGSLTIESPAGHGVVSKDELTVTGGVYTLITASHGLNGKDNVCISGGTFNISAGKDGIQADNDEDVNLGFVYISGGDFAISAEGDGITASSYLQIESGTFEILAGGGYTNGSKQSSDNWGGFGGGGSGGGEWGGRSGGASNTASTDDSTSMKGIKSGAAMVFNGGTFTLDCADDAVHSDTDLTINNGTFTIASGDDGVHAEENLTFNGGSVTVNESYEGMEALHILITGGKAHLIATDDGLNAAGGTDQSGGGGRDQMFGGGSGGGEGSITISGGDLYISAGGDGVDANGTLEITGGYTVLAGPTQGDTSVLDFDASGVITGGTFIGTGARGMGHSFSRSENQGHLSVNVGSAPANTKITVSDAEGNIILTHTPELGYNIFIFSSPDLQKGKTYTITIGSSSATVTAQ